MTCFEPSWLGELRQGLLLMYVSLGVGMSMGSHLESIQLCLRASGYWLVQEPLGIPLALTYAEHRIWGQVFNIKNDLKRI